MNSGAPTDLVQLIDAFLHAADGGHRSQSVGVQVSEAVLPADLKERHHRTFLSTHSSFLLQVCSHIRQHQLIFQQNQLDGRSILTVLTFGIE